MEEATNQPKSAPELIAEAQLEKLRLEIEELKKKNQKREGFARYMSFITVLISILTFGYGVYQYGHTKERESMKPLWEKQIQLSFEASAAAAAISRTKDPELKKKSEETFWQLYQGPLVIVEDEDVSTAMDDFAECLDGRKQCKDEDVQELSLKLASTLRQSISKSWNLPIGKYTEGKFVY